MSAGSPNCSRSQSRSSSGCNIISPQHVTDPTILDQVSGFINEVATYNIPSDSKDQIQWARFEQLDCDAFIDNSEKAIPSSLVLVLGYTTGVQVWVIPANGEAVELLSWRHGTIRVLRILPLPYNHSSTQDEFVFKRPLMALCDTNTPGPHHCTLNFLSLKTGEQVKVIKFKNPILDVLANRRSVVVTFSERIAVFDAYTLEDRLTVTTCYLSPGIYPNPVALGSRWMAYAENKLISNKRSNGGNEGEAVQSYTATVLHAAKTLGKGLRELGETVASSLTGNSTFKPGSSPVSSQTIGNCIIDSLQKGVVTVLDIEHQVIDDKSIQIEGMVAHFVAHTEAIVGLAFDPSGLLLLTTDKRGHDFHLFRIHPHPGGSSMAAVHHLYVLHRGDTTARVQDICFSPDSRWAAVSTLRGTTHVFPITPYGGNVGVRTHATPHVVNRMSRFHRSAGLAVEGRSNSPVCLIEMPANSNLPYNNPRLPPYPHPTVVHPLEQIRLFVQTVGNIQQRSLSGRPRLNSSDDVVQVAHRLCCCFAPPRAWFENATPAHELPLIKQQIKPVESLFVMSCHGTLLQYDLDSHPSPSVPKEKVCDETSIALTVQAKAQWVLQRQLHLPDVPLPVSAQNLNLLPYGTSLSKTSKPSHLDDRWLSQVEIITHAGPHRRLWMGPQFTFKTYVMTNGSPVSLNETQVVDVGRSKPVNMPTGTSYPIVIESGSVSSCEQSPKLLDTYQHLDEVSGTGELQLKEDLADAMLESPGVRESGGRCVIVSMKQHTACIAKVVNPLGTVVTIQSDEDTEVEPLEDAVIHENCDEALFRPVVTPKPILYADCKISKNFKTTSKPIKLNEKVKPASVEESCKVSIGKVEPCSKVSGTVNVVNETKIKSKNHRNEQKYQSKTEVVVNNIKYEEQIISKSKPEIVTKYVKNEEQNVSKSKPAIVTKNIKNEEENVSKLKLEIATKNIKNEEQNISKSEILTNSIKNKQQNVSKSKPEIVTKYVKNEEQNVSKLKPEIVTKSIKNEEQNVLKSKLEIVTKNIKNEEQNVAKPKSEIVTNSIKNEEQNVTKPKSEIVTNNMKNEEQNVCKSKSLIIADKLQKTVNKIIDSSIKSPEPVSALEIIPLVKSTDTCEKPIAKTVSGVSTKRSKTKSKNILLLDNHIEMEKSILLSQEDLKKNVINIKTDNAASNVSLLNNLITTPDLMDNIDDTLDCTTAKDRTEKDRKETKDAFDFHLLNNHDDLVKEDKFEDARDTADLLESFTALKVDNEVKSYESLKYQGLEHDEIVFLTEEEKIAIKKPRKLKTKLGVRLSKNKDVMEKDSVEVNSLTGRKTKNLLLKKEEQTTFLDLPEVETVDMPKMSYSTVAKQHLLEIDPLEDICKSNVLLPMQRTDLKLVSKDTEEQLGVFKNDKLSDDEKQENSSSQPDTTESDDSVSKVVAMDTEEDACQPQTAAPVLSEKTVKSKSKKKKR